MNELTELWLLLQAEIPNEIVFMRTFGDGSGSIGNESNESLNWMQGCIQEAITWGDSEEGVAVLQECLKRIKANPREFQFV